MLCNLDRILEQKVHQLKIKEIQMKYGFHYYDNVLLGLPW